MRDSCYPIEFKCEHYLTFSKSLLRVILCLLSQRKNYGEILKTKEFLTEERANLWKMIRGANMKSILTFKVAFRMLSNCFLPQAEESVILLTR